MKKQKSKKVRKINLKQIIRKKRKRGQSSPLKPSKAFPLLFYLILLNQGVKAPNKHDIKFYYYSLKLAGETLVCAYSNRGNMLAVWFKAGTKAAFNIKGSPTDSLFLPDENGDNNTPQSSPETSLARCRILTTTSTSQSF